MNYIDVSRNESIYEKLETAVLKEELEEMAILAASGFDLDALDIKGETLLLKAIRNNKLDSARELIKHGADIDKRDTDANTPLIELCRANAPIELIETVIAKTKNINNKNNLGDTALHQACYYGYANIVELLIKNGADLNIHNRQGELPLHKTAVYGWTDIAKYLIDNGSDTSCADGDGNTIHHLACIHGYKDLISHIEKLSTCSETRNKNGQKPSECNREGLKYDLSRDGERLRKEAAEYVRSFSEASKR